MGQQHFVDLRTDGIELSVSKARDLSFSEVHHVVKVKGERATHEELSFCRSIVGHYVSQ